METTTEKIIGVFIILIVLGSITFGLAKPYFEAKSFNECTGGNATYETAFFTQLRIEDCKKD